MTLSNGNRPPDDNRYEKKSNRIYAWSDLLKSFSKFLWLIVIAILLVAVGKMYVFKSTDDRADDKPITKPVVEKIDWSKVNKAVEAVMTEARKETETIAADKLDRWIKRNMDRVDKDFLDWYFGYWTQQGLGLKGLLAQVLHWVDGDNPSAAEKITQVVQEEFANRVIRPQIAQMEVERIINETVTQYSSRLRSKLDAIPEQYQIKKADWNRYIKDVSIMIRNVEANRSVPVSLKAVAGITAGGTLLVARALRPVITKIGGKISARLATKSAAKMAAKTGGKVAAKTGGKFMGTIIAVGIIIWDVWDHYSTKKKAMPVLRQNIRDYFQEVKQSILHDPEFGLMTIIYQMEQSLSPQLEGEKAPAA